MKAEKDLKQSDATVGLWQQQGREILKEAKPVDHVTFKALCATLQGEWNSAHVEHAYRDL